jgi:phosphoglycolate phosphatase
VVFDLDGTLIDSRRDIARATNHSLHKAGFAQLNLAQVTALIGDGSRVLLARASGLPPDDRRVEAMLESFFDFYKHHAADDTTLLDGAREVLDALAGMPLAVCTNKPRIITDAVLLALGIDRHFAVVVGAGDVPWTKPHPAPLLRVGERLGLAPATLVMVGDGPQDVECARAAGVRSIGITDAVIVPLSKLEPSRPQALVPLRQVPALVERWAQPG